MLFAFDYHYLKKVHQGRDAAPVDFKLLCKKQASACLLGRWVCPDTSDQLVYALSRPHKNCSEAQWGQSDGVTVFTKVTSACAGAVMSLTKLF